MAHFESGVISEILYKQIDLHFGHRVVIARYGPPGEVWNVAIECEDCGEVIIDVEKPEDRDEPH